MIKWEKIETAPRDGSNILLSDGKNVAIGYWQADAGYNGLKNFWYVEAYDLVSYAYQDSNKWTHWSIINLPE